MYSVNRERESGYDILGEGFEEELQRKIDENPGVKLVVIDVLQKIKPAGRRNQNAYEADYATLGALSKIALSNELCVLLVHHTKKSMDAGDWTNNASGSTAMTGAVDTSMSITREKRSDTEATLHVTGRDIKPQDLVINWDKNALRWRMEGTQAAVAQRKELEEYNRSPVVHTIKGLVNGGGGEWSGTVSELIGKSHYYKKIFFSPAQTGKEISRWEMLLSFDGYYIESSHTKKGTVYTFKRDTFEPVGEEEEGEYVL